MMTVFLSTFPYVVSGLLVGPFILSKTYSEMTCCLRKSMLDTILYLTKDAQRHDLLAMP